MNQQVLSWNDSPLEMNVLGEKPYKLMVLKQDEFPIPDFFTIVTDGSGKLTIDDSVHTAFSKLSSPIIARSAHPFEGTTYSFSGIFESIPNVTRLLDTANDEVNYVSPVDRPSDFSEGANLWALEDEWFNTRTFSLTQAYSDIIKFASPGGRFLANERVSKYLNDNGISDFNPQEMNVLVMEQRKVDVFGMFLTSDQSRPDETVIHYQDRRTNTGSWIVYNKKDNHLQGNIPDGLETTLLEFGRLAARVEKKFGKVQQVEMGLSDKGIELYQSRDINIKGADSVPRFAHYRTLSADLRSEGMGYYHLPVLVIDALSNVFDDYIIPSIDEKMKLQVSPYREQINAFIASNPEYIVVLKDGTLFLSYGLKEESLYRGSKEERYTELNAITRNAKVLFQGKCQNAIRHEDWDLVESGGIRIGMSDDEQLANLFIHNTIDGEIALHRARTYSSSPWNDDKYIPENVTLIESREPIKTGDFIHVLANKDGTFVWRD